MFFATLVMVLLLSLPTKRRRKNEAEQALKAADSDEDLPGGNILDQLGEIETGYLLYLYICNSDCIG